MPMGLGSPGGRRGEPSHRCISTHLRILSAIHLFHPSQLPPSSRGQWLASHFHHGVPAQFAAGVRRAKAVAVRYVPLSQPPNNTQLSSFTSQSCSPNNSFPTSCLPQSDTSSPSPLIAIRATSSASLTPMMRSTRSSPSSSNGTTCAPSAAPSRRTSTPSNANESS